MIPQGLGRLLREAAEEILVMVRPVRKVRVTPLARERKEFEEEAKDQFRKLKEKGLSIPVFTL